MSKRKKEEHSEGSVIENPDVIVSKTEEFFKDKKKRNGTVIIGGVLILAVLALFFYRGHIESQNSEAQEEMFQAVYFYEADSLSKALNGDGLNYGFLKIISDYPGTDAANLANFYAGSNLIEYFFEKHPQAKPRSLRAQATVKRAETIPRKRPEKRTLRSRSPQRRPACACALGYPRRR